MGRVFFPTYRSNVLGVRDVGSFPTLGSMDGAIVVPRAPAEPYPRASNNPTGPMLGLIMANGGGAGYSEIVRRPGVITYVPPAPGPAQQIPQPPPLTIAPNFPPVDRPPSPITPTPGAPYTPPVAAPPVSQQTSPTPTVTVPQQPQTGAVLVSSGGGTAAPSTAPITIQTGSDTTGAITSWLSGSTVIFSYPVPNALLAAGVILLFAMLTGGKKR